MMRGLAVMLLFFSSFVVAKPIETFQLQHVLGTESVLVNWNVADKSATVVVFLSARCPCSMGHEDHLAELAKKFPSFRFVGIHSNKDEPGQLVKKHFGNKKLPFPVLDDENQSVADRFGALKTPHAFVVGRDGQVLFEGGVDDSRLAINAGKNYLETALEEISQGKTPSVKVAKALGCSIRRVRTSDRS